jgi:C1A family cysteine protease
LRTAKRYGWRRDLPDHRDFKLAPPTLAPADLPPLVDLRPQCPQVYDQGNLGSCTANAIAAAFEFELLRQKLADFTPSRLFIYYNERVMEGDPGQDNGAQIRDGMSSVATLGVCQEVQWPYNEWAFDQKPDPVCYTDALANKANQYLSIAADLIHLKACLAGGFPFVLGISVYESFESPAVAQSGIVPLPAPQEDCVGGHAILCVGYDDSKQAFLMRNSWGSDWGLGGYFYLPYAYVINMGLGSDFWTIRSVA